MHTYGGYARALTTISFNPSGPKLFYKGTSVATVGMHPAPTRPIF